MILSSEGCVPVGFHRQQGYSLVSSVSGHPAHSRGRVSWAAISTDTVLGSSVSRAPESCDSRGCGDCWLVGTWPSSKTETRKAGAGSFINKPRGGIGCPCAQGRKQANHSLFITFLCSESESSIAVSSCVPCCRM